jgi:hypothetical protein
MGLKFNCPFLAFRGVVACCRFRGYEDKIVTMELESGYDETEVQPRVQAPGGEARDRAGRDGLNRPVFTGGQNSRRIARYGTCTKEEDVEAVSYGRKLVTLDQAAI